MTTSIPIIPASSLDNGAISAVPKDIVKQEITIKEITPVSEIPITTDVKIKEILPSPGIEVAEYSSSKSPLIPREATSEKNTNTDVETSKPEQEMPSVIEVHSSPETVYVDQSKTSSGNKGIDARAPSKISLSTQDSINSEIYPSPLAPFIATMGSPYVTPDTRPVASTTKAPMLEEEDPSLFDHNPAFPPLPDDLSVLSNHGDEIVPEPSADSDHIPVEHAPAPEVNVAGITTSTEAQVKEPLTTNAKYFPETSVATTERSSEIAPESSTIPELTSTSAPIVRENPTIKLRSAIPTETFSAPSEEGTANEGKVTASDSILDFDAQKTTALEAASTTILNTTTEAQKKSDEITKPEEITKSEITKSVEITTQELKANEQVSFLTTGAEPEPEIKSTTQKEILSTTQKVIEYATTEKSSSTPQEQTTISIAKSNIPTEVTSQTELSSLPIETSDQNPQESSASENVSKDTLDISTADPVLTTTDSPAASSEVITVSKADSRAIENVETTEFILTSFGLSESSTDAVELIKIPGDSDKNAAIIDSADGNKNALIDLMKLVSDVASISEHTDSPLTVHQVGSTSYSDSEELIPVNVGYKSKNKNFNQNSITEVPFKSKGVLVNKQKGIEIEDDESSITDSPPPNDKVEPTTRRPIIDNVSDDMPETKTEKKDIEIITQSYVPTINRRPTKVILKAESSELSDRHPQDDAPASASSEMVTDSVTSRDSNESVTGSLVELTTAAPFTTTKAANNTLSAAK